MYQYTVAFLISATILLTSNVMAAEKSQDDKMFENIFSAWTEAFNHRDLQASCNLFSRNIHANYQGAPPKNYASICDGFKKIFQGTREYQYKFKLHHVYRSNDLAAVRITWYLQIMERGKLLSETRDEGLDVFQREGHGTWRIVNYLAYPVNATA